MRRRTTGSVTSSSSSGRQVNSTRIGRAGEARRQVVEGFQGRAIGPLQVIEPDAARHGARGQRRQAVGDGGHQPSVSARAVGAGRARATAWRDGRQQAGQFRTDARVTEALHGARVRDGGSQQLHDRAVGDGPLADVRARGEDRAASGADAFDDGLGEPGLADAGLADDRGDPARSGRVRRDRLRAADPGPHPGRRGSRPAGEHRLARGLAARPDPAPGRAHLALRPARPRPGSPRTAGWWTRAAPPRARGPGSRRTAGTGEARRPDPPTGRTDPSTGHARLRRGDRGPGDGRPPRSHPAGRRPPGSPRPACPARVITVRSTATARAARQSSNSGLSRRLKPARNGPRARAAAAASDRRESDRGQPLQVREVHPNPRGIERNARAIDEDRFGAGGRAERRQCPPQGPVRRRCIRIGPEQRRKLVARERSPLRAQQGEDRHGLAGIHDEWGAVHQHLRRPEQPDVESVATAPWSRRNGTHSPGSLVTFQ